MGDCLGDDVRVPPATLRWRRTPPPRTAAGAVGGGLKQVGSQGHTAQGSKHDDGLLASAAQHRAVEARHGAGCDTDHRAWGVPGGCGCARWRQQQAPAVCACDQFVNGGLWDAGWFARGLDQAMDAGGAHQLGWAVGVR